MTTTRKTILSIVFGVIMTLCLALGTVHFGNNFALANGEILTLGDVLATEADFPDSYQSGWLTENNFHAYSDGTLFCIADDTSYVFVSLPITTEVAQVGDNYNYTLATFYSITFNMQDGKLASITATSLSAQMQNIAGTYQPTHFHDQITFTPWTNADTLPTVAGNYRLDTDITVSQTWNVPTGTEENPSVTNLCLNGHVIRLVDREYNVTEAICIGEFATLNIYDDGKTNHYFVEEYVYYAEVHEEYDFEKYWVLDDTLTEQTADHKVNSGVIISETCGIFVDKGTLNLYNGAICGCGYASSDLIAAGVTVGGGTFNMYGGAVSGNYHVVAGGVGVTCDYYDIDIIGNFNMYGGEITNNYGYLVGGGVCVSDSEFVMYDGVIGNNVCPMQGGGVCVHGERFVMLGGKITDNLSVYGGGVAVGDVTEQQFSTFVMHGGEITGNYALSGVGGGVFVLDCSTFVADGGKITGNRAVLSGGGVYLAEPAGQDRYYCVAQGTMITLADGSKTEVENISVGDEVKVFDHISGELTSSKVFYLEKSENVTDGVFTLHFTNDIDVTVVVGHSFFCKEENKYVTVTLGNVASYVNKQFYNAQTADWETLTGFDIVNTPTDSYSVVTECTLNFVTNDMLSCGDAIYTVLINTFDYQTGYTLKYDEEKMSQDINNSGLFEYSDAKFATEETYNALNLQYLSVAMDKELITYDQLIGAGTYQAERDSELVRKIGIYLGGTVQIIGNISAEERVDNVFLWNHDNVIRLKIGTGTEGNGVAKPQEGMSVGVTLQIWDSNPKNVCGAITASGTADDIKYFVPDKDGFIIKLVDERLQLCEPVWYDVWVDGKQVSEANADDILGNGKVSFNEETATLVFCGDCEIAGVRCATNDLVITCDKSVTVTLTAPILLGNNGDNITVTIKGNGNNTLTIKPKQTENVNNFRPIGIRSGNTLVLEDGVILTDSNATAFGGGMINVANSAILQMTGGLIQNSHVVTTDYDNASAYLGRGGAIYVANGGTFVMQGGEIVNCSATVAGGAIYNIGTVEIYDGAIHNCTVDGLLDGGVVKAKGGAIYLYGGSSFAVTGGAITDNTLGKVEDMRGAGIYVANGASVTIGGTVKIADNTDGNGNYSNMYLYEGVTFYVSYDVMPATGMSVGISTQSVPTYESPITVVFDDVTQLNKYFFADNERQRFTFDTDGMSLCVNTDVTFDKNYKWNNGIAITYGDIYQENLPTYTYFGDSITVDELALTYYRYIGGIWTKLDEKPINAGSYKAVITVQDDYYTGSIDFPFAIAKATVAKPDADNSKFSYNGEEHTYQISANGLYSISNNKQIEAGSYTVTVSLIDKINYEWSDGTTGDLTFDFTIHACSFHWILVALLVVGIVLFVLFFAKKYLFALISCAVGLVASVVLAFFGNCTVCTVFAIINSVLFVAGITYLLCKKLKSGK